MFRAAARVLLLALAAWAALPAFAMSRDARLFTDWVLGSRDHAGLPFAVVDKLHAQLHVFDAQGRLAGTTPVLLGAAPGDHTVPGAGERAQHGRLHASDKTTPAGRFESFPGHTLTGERVVWVDYDGAFAIHRLRPGRAFKERSLRLASDRIGDRRVSDGCVVVPEAFYEQVVLRVLGASQGVVYVLPERQLKHRLARFPAAG